MESFPTKDTKDTRRNKRKRLNSGIDDRGVGGGAGDVDAMGCAGLGAHSYEVCETLRMKGETH
jgi:hypothetical protein